MPWHLRFLAPALALGAAVAALGGALVSQYVFGLEPCVLCIYQRYPYVAVIVLALLALLLARRPGPAPAVLMALIGAAFLTTAAIGAFHVGVEQKWWTGTSACGSGLDAGASFEEFKAQILAGPTVRCDEVPWSLFGVSMAGYNFLYAGFAGLAALWAAGRLAGSGR